MQNFLKMKNRFLLIIIFTFCSVQAHAQFSKDDSLLLNHKKNHHFSERKVVFGITNSENAIVKYNPLTLTGSSLMFIYQKFISAQLSSTCIYHPSCSEYSRQLFTYHGGLVGLLGSSDRLMRCDRISATTLSRLKFKNGKFHESVEIYSLKED